MALKGQSTPPKFYDNKSDKKQVKIGKFSNFWKILVI